MITGRQIREARALLGMHQARLAARARLNMSTVCRAEASDDEPSITAAHADAIRSVLEAAGVEFITGNGGGAGVRLTKAIQE